MIQMSYIKILNGPNSDEGRDAANTGPVTGDWWLVLWVHSLQMWSLSQEISELNVTNLGQPCVATIGITVRAGENGVFAFHNYVNK